MEVLIWVALIAVAYLALSALAAWVMGTAEGHCIRCGSEDVDRVPDPNRTSHYQLMRCNDCGEQYVGHR